MTEPLVIAIDGPAGAGKSTVAQKVAVRLGLMYVDSGATYRAAALKVLEAGIDPQDEPAVAKLIGETDVKVTTGEGEPRVLVDGEVVTRPGPDRAVVFQDASLLPWRTVLNNVCYGLECLGVGGREAKERAGHLISLVGLSGFEHHYPHELSGGMQQRVNLARALVVDPKILLMDEPFASLDAQTRELMQEELTRIWAKSQKTVLFITHQIDEAIYLADRVMVFSGRPGKVKQSVTVDIGRPRPIGVKRQARFHALEDRIWGLIEEDVKSGMAADRVQVDRFDAKS